MKFRYTIISLAAAIISFSGCSKEDCGTVSFEEVADMPEGRASAAVAVCVDAAYIYGGRSSKGISGDLWKFTPEDGGWEKLRTPMKGRTGCIAVENEGIIYIGLGFTGGVYNDDSYLRDLWSYNPSTGEWKQLKDCPSKFTTTASAFVEDGKIYVCFGYYGPDNEHVQVYDIASDEWTSIHVGKYRLAETVTGAVGQRHFVGNNEVWFEFDVPGNRLEKRRSCRNGGARVSAAMLSDGQYLYMFGGREWNGVTSKEDILRYDTSSDKWTVCGKLPGDSGMENAVCFTIDGKHYMGLGETGKTIHGNIYRVHCK